MDLIFRPAQTADADYLLALFSESRGHEFQFLPDPQKTDLLRMQFDLQDRQYKTRFPGAEFCIVQQEGTDVGRTIIYRAADHILFIDLIIESQYRNRGIGTHIIKHLQNEARQMAGVVKLSVIQTNVGAIRLYEKLGFEQAEVKPPYLSMIWTPPSPRI